MLVNNPLLTHWCTETVFKEKHCEWDPMPEMHDYHSLYLKVNSVVHSYYKEKGVDWVRPFLLVEHICICLLIIK